MLNGLLTRKEKFFSKEVCEASCKCSQFTFPLLILSLKMKFVVHLNFHSLQEVYEKVIS